MSDEEMLNYFREVLEEIQEVITLIEDIGITGNEDLDIFLQELLGLLNKVKSTVERAIESLERQTATTTSTQTNSGTAIETESVVTKDKTEEETGNRETTTSGTFEPATAPSEPGTEELDYCCGSWGTYLTEDDQNAGTVTSVLSVVACTNYTARVQIQLRYVPPDKRQDHSNPPKTSLL